MKLHWPAPLLIGMLLTVDSWALAQTLPSSWEQKMAAGAVALGAGIEPARTLAGDSNEADRFPAGEPLDQQRCAVSCPPLSVFGGDSSLQQAGQPDFKGERR